jgi:hypothetical protein
MDESVTAADVVERSNGVMRLKSTPRLRPNEMRALRAETGKTMTEIMADDIDALQFAVWLQARREGRDVSWEEAGDIEIEFVAPAPPDPGSGGDSTSTPPFAATGE